jgi:hypothetical protein
VVLKLTGRNIVIASALFVSAPGGFFSLGSYVSWCVLYEISPSSDENFSFGGQYKQQNFFSLHQFSLNMDAENIAPSKHFSLEDKRVAIELWKAKVPLKSIRDQLSMSESTLRQILEFLNFGWMTSPTSRL